jgi:hypothetical protein
MKNMSGGCSKQLCRRFYSVITNRQLKSVRQRTKVSLVFLILLSHLLRVILLQHNLELLTYDFKTVRQRAKVSFVFIILLSHLLSVSL